MRKPSQRDTITREIRNRILSGAYRPGDRLPTRRALCVTFRTTPVTLQRSFDRLRGEGFVQTAGRRGTFVTPRPPHLSRVVLVFPYRDRPERPWPHFWRALAIEATRLAGLDGQEIVFSFGNETHQDLAAYQELVADVLAHRVAGLIFVARPFYLEGSPVREMPGIPRVAIMPRPEPPNIRAVDLEPTFLQRALFLLSREGRRRIAIITVPQVHAATVTALRAHGIQVPPYWVQTASVAEPDSARHAIRLLMAEKSNRPHGLVIADDNLVPAATVGLKEAGLRVAEDVSVVGHCNFPHPTPSAMPIRRIGYDVREVLETCVRLIQDARRNRPVPDVTRIPLREEPWGSSPDGAEGAQGEVQQGRSEEATKRSSETGGAG